MKPIKFDMPINGTKVRNLEELRDNFTTEILELHSSGVLAKWCKSRTMDEQVERLNAIAADQGRANVLMELCEIFEVDADLAVIEAALSDGKGKQGVALHADPEELKYKEKFEQLSNLMDELKRKKLYLTRDDYNHFVKDKIQIENDGKVESVVFFKEIYINKTGWNYEHEVAYRIKRGDLKFSPEKKEGDAVEVGDVIVNIVATKYDNCAGGIRFHNGELVGQIKSPVRGIFVKLGEEPSTYQMGDPICFIRIDHDTAPTIKIIS